MDAAGLATALAQSRDRFLSFLRARVGDAAEDVLQAAWLKALQKGDSIRDDENAVAWFWRVLRNAVADVHRERALEHGAVDALARSIDAEPADDPELRQAICRCLGAAIADLPPDAASLLRRVDLDGVAVPDAARGAGITANNAGVRLHRARAALRDALRRSCGACARHACLDCRCRAAP